MNRDVIEQNTARIRCRELLTNVFGDWPRFHDAEVLRVALDRADRSLVATVYVFHMTNAVDSEGYYVLEKKSAVTLKFTNLVELSLSDFNQQNVLSELAILDIRTDQNERINFSVRFSSSFGLEATFKCEDIEVMSVEPYHPNIVLPRSAPRIVPQ